MNKKIGIELIRIIATFAVVLLHSGDASTGSITEGSETLRSFFSFPVPVFLAISFYLTSSKFIATPRTNTKKKLYRILLPYIFFETFYLLFKTLGETGLDTQLYFNLLAQKIYSDPIGILFMGASSVHLYFLPLLAVGVIVFYWMARTGFIHNLHGLRFLLFTIFSLIVYQILDSSGNTFVLAKNSAFTVALPNINDLPLIRIALTSITWAIRCLPYILFSLLLAQNEKFFASSRVKSNVALVISVLAIFFLLFAKGTINQFNLNTVSDLFNAYFFLVAGICLSAHLNQSGFVRPSIQAISGYSFGIYLIHPAVLGVLEKVLATTSGLEQDVITVLSIMTFATITFVLSLITIQILDRTMKHKTIRLCLGL